MRLTEWTDENGYKRGALLRTNDADEDKDSGIPVSPPDVGALDWDAVKRDLHNALYEQSIFDWSDVQARQNGVKSAVLSALRKRVVALYRQ